MKKIMIFTIITLALALATSACDDKPDDTNSDTIIPVYGGTAIVTADPSVSGTDWEAAIEKLQGAFGYILDYSDSVDSAAQSGFVVIRSNGIRIVSGNANPANVNGVLTLSVDYLKSNTNTNQVVAGAIINIARTGGFSAAVSAEREYMAMVDTFSAPKGV